MPMFIVTICQSEWDAGGAQKSWQVQQAHERSATPQEAGIMQARRGKAQIPSRRVNMLQHGQHGAWKHNHVRGAPVP